MKHRMLLILRLNGGDSSPGPEEKMAEPIDKENPKNDFDDGSITDKKSNEKISKVDAAENRVPLDERKFSNEEPIDGVMSTMVENGQIAQIADANSSATT